MAHKSLHRLHRKVTRGQLERRLGGSWTQDESDPTRRKNGKWETYKDYSKVVQGRRDCYARNLKSGAVRSGRNWNEIASALGLQR